MAVYFFVSLQQYTFMMSLGPDICPDLMTRPGFWATLGFSSEQDTEWRPEAFCGGVGKGFYDAAENACGMENATLPNSSENLRWLYADTHFPLRASRLRPGLEGPSPDRTGGGRTHVNKNSVRSYAKRSTDLIASQNRWVAAITTIEILQLSLHGYLTMMKEGFNSRKL